MFSPVIDKLLFAATKADHVTIDQHSKYGVAPAATDSGRVAERRL
ncbi:YcjX family protein [Klebsiella pneumoniae subsp. pneumoniae]|nr:YcjX family protein [Klebsiella pneumoniae subsp. pneumoniae]